jgi:hypothetical protein
MEGEAAQTGGNLGFFQSREKAGREVSASAQRKVSARSAWILLPALGLFTILMLAATTEVVARRMFADGGSGVAPCMVFNDPATGARGVPNSTCVEKSPENPPIEFQFNNCGHRAGMPCAPKAPGTYRIVMIGSSIPMGTRVQRGESFAATLPFKLSKDTGRRVELYNESMGFGFSHSTTLRFHDVLSAQPDMILWIVTPMDVGRSSLILPVADLDPWAGMSVHAKAWNRLKVDLSSMSLSETVDDLFNHTKTSVLLRHYLYQSETLYIRSFLAGPDHASGYLKQQLSPAWQGDLSQFESDAALMEAEAQKAGIPFVVTYVPERAQASMISMGTWPAGYDPYSLPADVRSIIERHHGIYVDILPDLRSVSNAGKFYYPVDGHPTPAGHALLSSLIEKGLTDGAIPALTNASRTQLDAARGH